MRTTGIDFQSGTAVTGASGGIASRKAALSGSIRQKVQRAIDSLRLILEAVADSKVYSADGGATAHVELAKVVIKDVSDSDRGIAFEIVPEIDVVVQAEGVPVGEGIALPQQEIDEMALQLKMTVVGHLLPIMHDLSASANLDRTAVIVTEAARR